MLTKRNSKDLLWIARSEILTFNQNPNSGIYSFSFSSTYSLCDDLKLRNKKIKKFLEFIT